MPLSVISSQSITLECLAQHLMPSLPKPSLWFIISQGLNFTLITSLWIYFDIGDMFHHFFLFVIVIISVKRMEGVDGEDCDYVYAITGGCPDLNKCAETCAPCFVGKGKVVASCVYGFRGLPEHECRCYFYNGAPCPTPTSPTCPKPPYKATYHYSAAVVQPPSNNLAPSPL